MTLERKELVGIVERFYKRYNTDYASQFIPLELVDIQEAYVNWLVEQHKYLIIQGLRTGKKIELNRVFVALKGHKSNPYEIIDSKELAEKEYSIIINETKLGIQDEEEIAKLKSRFLGRSAYMPSLEERDRLQKTRRNTQPEILNLGEAYQKYNRLVILGDPGSGKTTLARWLVLKFAQAMLKDLEQENVTIPIQMVNPDLVSGEENYNLGEKRLPILIKVADFAKHKMEYVRNSFA